MVLQLAEDEKRCIQIYKLPTTVQIDQFIENQVETEAGVYTLQYPVLTADTISEIAGHLQTARNMYLSRLTTADIIHTIDLAVQKWLDPEYPLRQLAELVLPVLTGYDKDMIRLELKRYLRNFRKKELLRFIDEEFDQPAMLDEFRPRKSGGFSRAFGPSLIFHVFSGNVPGVQLWSLIMGLLVKSANLGKTSMHEPLMAALFSQTLQEIDARLANAICVLPWKGGSADLEDATIEAADAVVVYGSNKAVEAIRPRVAQAKTFLSYGHKISFAMVGKEAVTPDRYFDTIHRLAEDASVYDQQSCLSPQAVFVEAGGVVDPQQFAQLLAAEMQRYHLKRPRAAVSDEEAMAIRAVRDQYEFQSLSNSDVQLYTSASDTAWTVIFHNQPGFNGSPLNRTVHVYACDSLEQAVSFIEPYKEFLQSCGVAVAPDRLFELAEILGAAGVTRISAIGEMNRAKPGWHHDGRFNLLDLVRIVDVEWTAEQGAERYDPDVE